MNTENFQTMLRISTFGIIVVIVASFLNFYFIFLGFVLFPGTLTVLGTW